ncbi:MAG: cache domain-containing protein [Treponemataceae bacterium]|nr:cache domain-containing protein [Treponemataceae bacterium]
MHLSIRSSFRLIIVATILPIFLILLINEVDRYAYLKENSLQEHEKILDVITEVQKSLTVEIERTLATLSMVPAIQHMNAQEVQAIFTSILQRDPHIFNISITDTKGKVVISARLQPGTDLSIRPHVQETLKTRAFAIGPYVRSILDGSSIIGYAYPLFNQEGNLIGAIAASLNLERYQEILARITIPKHTTVYLIDRDGICLFQFPRLQQEEVIGRPLDPKMREQLKFPLERGSFEITTASLRHMWYGYQKIYASSTQRPYITVMYGFPMNYISSSTFVTFLRETLLILLIIVLSFGGAQGLYTILFGNKLKATLGIIRSIEKGNFAFPVLSEHPLTEFGQIQHALYQMSQTIQRQIEELQKKEEHLQVLIREKSLLMKEMHHRIKNNLQLIRSLLVLEDTTDCETFRDSMVSRLESIGMIHQMLYQKEGEKDIDIYLYAQDLIQLLTDLIALHQKPEIIFQGESLAVSLEQAIPLGLILNELITNSLKYGEKDTEKLVLHLSISKIEKNLRIEFSDNGPGFTAPLEGDTATKGFGIQLIETLVSQLKGTILWEHEKGTKCIITVPLSS